MNIYIKYERQSELVINLTFTISWITNLVIDWSIDEKAATRSDHKVIKFTINTKYVELTENSINALFCMQKVDWSKFI